MRWLVILLIALTVPFCRVHGFWSGTVQDQIISQDDNFLGWYTRIAVDGNNTVHVVWNERIVNYPSQYEIHYSSSTDNGRTWSAMAHDIVISFDDDTSAETGSSIAVDSEDNVYVVWREQHGVDDEIHYSISTDGGATWSGQTADYVMTLPGGGNALNPVMAIDGDDVIHVVWNQDYMGGDDEIFYSYSTNGGETWSSFNIEIMISYSDGEASSYPDIAVGPDDEICVVWKEKDDVVSTHYTINSSISTDGGATWSGMTADHPVTQPVRIVLDPYVEIDPDGNIHVIWQGTQDTASPFHYEVFYSRSTDGGATWSASTGDRIISYRAPGDPSVFNPNLGIDHCGNLFAVWDEDHIGDDNEIHISVSTDGGDTWSGETQDEIISFPDGHPAYRPFLEAGRDDTLHVTWNEVTSTSYYQIHYSRGDAICIPSLPAVDDLTISMDGDDAVLGWGVIPDAIGYKIYRSDDPMFIPTPPDSIGYTTTNAYSDPDIIDGNIMKFYNVIVEY